MTNLKTSTLRPGLLVSLKTSVTGNVSYNKRDIDNGTEQADGALRAVWETERIISDPDEFEAANAVRSRVRAMITGVCSNSAFGLLCPKNRADDLTRVIAQARAEADTFNAKAKLTQVNFYLMAGEIARDDVEAVRAINSEVRDLMATIEEGLRNLDPQTVRTACKKARNLGAMLSEDAAAKVQDVIDTARAAARKIAAAGEQSAVEIDLQAIQAIHTARTDFLDLDSEEKEVAPPSVDARAIDLAPSDEITTAAPAMPVLELE
jgi:hypothetical protein